MRPVVVCCSAVLATTLLGSCSPYYSFLPSALTYEMSSVKRSNEPPPNPVEIAQRDLPLMFVSDADPKDAAVAPVRKGEQGWAFCLKATVSSNAGRRAVTLWITVIVDGLYDRRPAVPADQCATERYTPVPRT
jgi:hypothetical protein